ncbi:hypothetical protein EKK58_03940 [Candidatus Dependentiae bacterium]|nr:MAG: hypothetical protein EKK58_03940 [Candidatus Dependentiae bacterium]
MDKIIKKMILLNVFLLTYQPIAKSTENELVVVNSIPLTLQVSANAAPVIHSTKELPLLVDVNPHQIYNIANKLDHSVGVIGENFIFLNTDYYSSNQSNDILQPRSIGLNIITNDKCIDEQNTKYTCQGKGFLAFYDKKINCGTTSSNFSFCIVKQLDETINLNNDLNKTNKTYSLYFVFPALIDGTQDSIKNFFQTNNKLQKVLSLKKNDKTNYLVTESSLSKAHLYMPKIKKTNNVHCYVFLLNQNNNKTCSIDIAYFCPTDSNPFIIKHCVDNVLVRKNIKTYFKQKRLFSIFYSLYKSQNQKNNHVNLAKKQFTKAECTINILDTLCKENTNFIHAQFLVRVVLSSVIQTYDKTKISTPHFYGLLTTNLPYGSDNNENELKWESTFFTIPSGTTNFDQPLFFAYDHNAMPRNDVRKIINESTQNNNQEPNSPVLNLIKSINKNGFVTDQYTPQQTAALFLPSNQQNVPAIEYNQNTYNQSTYINRHPTFVPTETLNSILYNIKSSSGTTPRFNQPEQPTHFEHLAQIGSHLLSKITSLEKEVYKLQKTVVMLSRQHNDIFGIKKKIAESNQKLNKTIIEFATQKKNLVNIANEQKADFSKECQDTIKQSIESLQDMQQKVNEAFQNEQKNINQLIEGFETNQNNIIQKQEEAQKHFQQLIASFEEKNQQLEKAQQDINNTITKFNDIPKKDSDNAIKNLQQPNTYLTGALATVGAVSCISILLLFWYIHQMHARINALEALSAIV